MHYLPHFTPHFRGNFLTSHNYVNIDFLFAIGINVC